MIPYKQQCCFNCHHFSRWLGICTSIKAWQELYLNGGDGWEPMDADSRAMIIYFAEPMESGKDCVHYTNRWEQEDRG